ncbi:MAG TPA: trans-aconitate 2-methyltransferase [Rubrivivax sp.]|nr:trans-aconitate 2-methyltransferase [Rubrivivax sp.]
MADWDPALYRRFESERTRPAIDLLAHVPLAEPSYAVDLGCGPGNSTELLAARWPQARIAGIDSSEAMLASARERLPQLSFERADAADWQPAQPPDLIFANAVLQWVPGHEALFPRLFALLAPGGVLAVQLPDNLDQPSHRAMRELAAQAPWSAWLADAAALREKPLPATAYYDLLAPHAAAVEVWHTVYRHPMASPEAIVDWLRSTGLRVFVDALPEAERAGYLDAYRARIAAAYAPRADGRRLLDFPRLFVVARRKP